jgi:hypothetical protein
VCEPDSLNMVWAPSIGVCISKLRRGCPRPEWGCPRVSATRSGALSTMPAGDRCAASPTFRSAARHAALPCCRALSDEQPRANVPNTPAHSAARTLVGHMPRKRCAAREHRCARHGPCEVLGLRSGLHARWRRLRVGDPHFRLRCGPRQLVDARHGVPVVVEGEGAREDAQTGPEAPSSGERARNSPRSSPHVATIAQRSAQQSAWSLSLLNVGACGHVRALRICRGQG